MPIVQVSVWQGFGEDRARQLIQGITDSFVQVGVPAQSVQVVIHEVPRSHWGVGGQISSERPRSGGEAPTGSQRSPRGTRPERPGARPQRGPRPERPARPDTRPGNRPRRGGTGSR